MLYAGTASQKSYVKSLFYGDESTETDLGTGYAWSLRKLADQNDCHLVAAVQSKLAQSLLPKAGYVLPLWVSSEADTSVSPFKVRRKSLKADLARIRKNQVTCEYSASPKDLEFFWERMYEPHIAKQHAQLAILGSIDEFRDLLAQGNLLLTFALYNGERVAGGTLVSEGPVPCSRNIGLLDGDDRLKRLGVMTAIYIYELDWAYRHGYKRLNLGATRPFLRDGVLQYKKKFNISLKTNDYKKVIFIDPVRNTDAVVASLVANPMICIDNDHLVATVFEGGDLAKSTSPAPWQHQGKIISGLKSVKRIQLDSGNSLQWALSHP